MFACVGRTDARREDGEVVVVEVWVEVLGHVVPGNARVLLFCHSLILVGWESCVIMFGSAAKKKAAAEAEALAAQQAEEQAKMDNERKLHVHELQMTVSSLLQENADVEAQKLELEQEITAVKKAYTDRLSQAQDASRTLTAQVEESLQAQLELRNEMDLLRSKAREVERDREEERSKALQAQEHLRSSLEEVQINLTEALERSERLAVDVEQEKANQATAETKYKKNEAKLFAVIKKMEREIKELTKMQKMAVQISAEEKLAADEAAAALQGEMTAVQEELKTHQEDNKELQNALKDLEQIRKNMIQEAEYAQKMVDETKERQQQELEEMRQNCADEIALHKEKSNKAFVAATNEVNTFKEVVNKLKTELLGERSKLAEQSSSLNLQIEDLKLSINTAIQEKEAAEKLVAQVLDNAKAASDEKVNALQQELLEQSEQHNALLDQIEAEAHKIKRLESDNSLLSSKLDAATQSETALRNEYDILSVQMTKMNAKVSSLEADLERLSTEKANIAASYDEATRANESMSAANIDQRAAFERLTTDNIALVEEVERLKEAAEAVSLTAAPVEGADSGKLEALEQTNAALTKEVERLKEAAEAVSLTAAPVEGADSEKLEALEQKNSVLTQDIERLEKAAEGHVSTSSYEALLAENKRLQGMVDDSKAAGMATDTSKVELQVANAKVEELLVLETKMQTMQAGFDETIANLKREQHILSSDWTLEKESFLKRLKLLVVEKESIEQKLSTTKSNADRMSEQTKSMEEYLRRKDDEITASNKMVVRLSEELAALHAKPVDNAPPPPSYDELPGRRSVIDSGIVEGRIVRVIFEDGPMGMGLSPLAAGSTITAIANLNISKKGSQMTGIEKHNQDPQNKDNVVVAGMALKQVNKTNVFGYDYQDVIGLLKQTPRPVQLTFCVITYRDPLNFKTEEEDPFS
jgi:hypothetical protein